MRALLLAILLALAVPAYALDPVGNFDILIYANQDFEYNLTFKTNGVPENLTGRSYKMQAKKNGATAPFLNFSAMIVNPATGQTRYWLTHATTRNNANAAGIYDLMETGADGKIKYRIKGTIRIIDTVTRP